MNLDIKNNKCNLCNSKNHKLLYNNNGYSIAKCRECGLIFASPIPDKKFLHNLYQEEIAPLDGYLFPYSRHYESMLHNRIINYLKLYKKNGRLLEVGAGSGYFLDAARRSGYKTFGIEISRDRSEFARRILKLDIIRADIEEIEFKNQSFDVVILADVFEHVTDPLRLLKKARRILKDDGVVYIETPNVNFLARWVFGKHWDCMRAPWHMYFFNKNTLKQIFHKAGFDIAIEINHHKAFMLFQKKLRFIFKKM